MLGFASRKDYLFRPASKIRNSNSHRRTLVAIKKIRCDVIYVTDRLFLSGLFSNLIEVAS
jgi:hypothetical protein